MNRFRLLLAAAVVVLWSSGCARIQPPNRAADFDRSFITTGYCSCGKCCSWHRTWYLKPVDNATGRPKVVGQTASGAMAQSGTIAAPPAYPFGTILYVDGYGYGRVEDRGQAIKGDRLDLWFRSHGSASQWGKKAVKVKVWLPQGAAKPPAPKAAPARR